MGNLKKENFLVVIPLLLSLVFPLIHLYSIRNHPTSYIPIIDSGEYVQFARDIINSSFSFINSDHLSILYTWLLSLELYFSGQNLAIVKIFQAFLNCVTAFVFYSSAKKIFPAKSALVALYCWAFYGPIIFFTGMVMSVSLMLFFYVLAIFCFLKALEKKSLSWWGITGLVFGLAVLARPDILIFCFFALLTIIFTSLPKIFSLSNRLAMATVFLISFLTPLIFVGVENYVHYGEFSVMPTASGINFYIGNNQDFEKSISTRAGPYWDSIADLPLAEEHIDKSHVEERNIFYYKKILRQFSDHPSQFLDAIFFKIHTLVDGYELPAVFDIYSFRKHSPLLALLVWKAGGFFFPFSFLLPFAVLGIVADRNNVKEHWWLLVMLFSFLISLILYCNSLRFRLSIVPILILFASHGMVSLWQCYKEKGARQIRKPSAALVGLLLVFNIPYYNFTRNYNFEAEMYTFAGIEAVYQEKNINEGIILINKSLEMQKKNDLSCSDLWVSTNDHEKCNAILREYNKTLLALSYGYLADIEMIDNRLKEAALHYSKAIKIKDDYAIPYKNLGVILLNQGKNEEAKLYLEKAVAIKPYDPGAHHNLGKAFFNANKPEEALKEFNRSLENDADNPDLYFDLATTYKKLGKRKEATRCFMKALSLRKQQA